MGRATIDFGIDLGTTNSEIVCMDKGDLIVVRNQITQSEITPSAIKMNAKGTIVVGQSAYDELEYDPENIICDFKRWMGSGGRDGFTFKKCGRRMSAPELSAEILKVLKASASSRFGGEDINSAVITVPAMFLIPQCEDTKEAARMAGIDLCSLMQEPVAAAMAYGFNAENLYGNLLVFDLGGGTFDTTILAAKDGRLTVLAHDGDQKLGGKDYDQRLAEVINQKLSSEYGNYKPPFSGRAKQKIKTAAERAKKDLSLLSSICFEVKGLGDELDDIDTEIELTRSDLQRNTEELTARCISICKRALKSARISKDSLSAVIMVGGQTQTPYIREMVAAEFINVDYRLDPMTVVAQGAALFASTQRIPSRPSTVPVGKIDIQIAYSPTSTDLDADIGISVKPAIDGATLTIMRSDSGWSSGAVALPATGRIDATVVLRAKKANNFELQIHNKTGGIIRAATECKFTITHGLAVAQATTSRAFSVALENNEAQIIIPNGAPLPAKGMQKFITAHQVTAGDKHSSLNIFVLEGDNLRADRNIQIGHIAISGSDIPRSLPAGETVELTYRLDESKTLSVDAYFPSIRETKRLVRALEVPTLTSDEIEIELLKEKERLEQVERAAPDKVGSQFGHLIGSIEKDKSTASGDNDTAQKAALSIIELKKEIDMLQKETEGDVLRVRFESLKEDTSFIEGCGTKNEFDEYVEIQARAESAVEAKNIASLKHCVERLWEIYVRVLFAQDEFWKARFEMLANLTEFIDPLKAERLKEEGIRALKRDDMSSLRTIVWDLSNLLPTWQQGKLDGKFNEAGLGRARG